MQGQILKLGYLEKIEYIDDTKLANKDYSAIHDGNINIFLDFASNIDKGEEIEKLEKEKENMQKELSRAKGMISNKAFVEKAPVTLVEKEKEKITKYTELIAKIDMRISELKK